MNTAVPIGIGVGTTNVGNPDSLDRGRFDQGELYMLSFAASESDVRRLMTGDIPLEWRGGAFGGHPGIVLHLDPRNIGPAFTQWIEPHGHHALYHTEGVDSAHDLEEFTLKVNVDWLSFTGYLLGARDVIPEGYDVVSCQIAGSVAPEEEATMEIFYSTGTPTFENSFVLANLAEGDNLLFPDIRQLKPAGWGRIYVEYMGQFTGTITLKFRRR